MRRSEARPAPPPPEAESRLSVPPDRPLPVSLGGPGGGLPAPPSTPTAQFGPGAVRIPHDTRTEQIVMAAMCFDAERRRELIRSCPPERFFGKGHKEFVSTLLELDARGLDFALATVVQLSGGKLDEAYFRTVLDANPEAPPNLRHHVDVLAWDAKRVEVADGAFQDFMDLLRDQTTEPVVLLAAAQRIVQEVSHAAPSGGSHDPAALLAESDASYEARRLASPIWRYGIDGFEQDPKTLVWRVKPGMQPGKVTVVTALSGHGKSIVAKAVALGQVNLPAPRRGLFAAFEDQAREVLDDVAAMSLGFERDAVDEARLTDEQLALFRAEKERVASVVRFMKRPPTDGKKGKTTIAGRIDWAFSEAVRVGASWIALDLLARLFDSSKPEDEQRGWERFQLCAEETGVHGLATHQQRAGDVEQRGDKRPTRDGLKGSKGALEVADTIIGVHRPALVESVPDDKIELILLKQRRGRWPFCVRFDFDPQRWSIRGGREVAYLRPGEEGVDDFVQRPSRGGRS